MTILAFLLLLGAVARLTRLLTEDTICAPLRDWHCWPKWVKTLLSCAWCASLWISAALFACAWAWPWMLCAPWFVFAAAALAASYVYGLIAGYFDAPPPAQTLHIHHYGAPPCPTTPEPGCTASAAAESAVKARRPR